MCDESMQPDTLAFVADPRCGDAGGVEVAATVHVALNTAENQGGWVGRPAEGAHALEPRAAAALAHPTLVVASAREGIILTL